MRRLAADAWNAYKDNMVVQDLVEVAITALGWAGAQALFSEMGMGEIAATAALSMGAGMAGRPVGDRVGRAAGRMADKRFPESSKKADKYARDVIAQMEGSDDEMMKGMNEVMSAKLKHHYADGTGPFEALGSIYGRSYGDNVAQAGVGVLAPLISRSNRSESEDQQPEAGYGQQHIDAVASMLRNGDITESQAQAMLR